MISIENSIDMIREITPARAEEVSLRVATLLEQWVPLKPIVKRVSSELIRTLDDEELWFIETNKG